ncbi:MAG: sulfotransferase [Bacteroidales bacterium]|nr:sulfotransferase [Bacteroidales bacterium]
MLNKGKKILIPTIKKWGAKKAQKHFTKPPVIIGGCGRSGTTLLLSMLSAHPSIFAFPDELSIFNHWKKTSDGQWTPQRLDRMYRYLLIHRIPKDITRWCEKTPYNIRYLNTILNYFNQNVKIIHIIRDGRDVCMSKHPDKPGEYWVDPDRWINDVRKGLEYKDHPQVYTVFYEDLIANYHKHMRKIMSFLDEPFSKEIQQWYIYTQVKENNAWYGSVENLHNHSVGKWRNKENIQRLRELMAYPGFEELLRELNYPMQ